MKLSKLLSWVVLAIFVLIVPLGSWYYLKSGLEYRKKALAELSILEGIDSNLDSLSLFKNRTTLLVISQDSSVKENLLKINDQFKNSPGFNIYVSDTIAPFLSIPKNYMSQVFGKYDDYDYLLIDNKMQIRNKYHNNIEEIKRLIEHMALIIPRPKEVDIKIKK